jgi:hypothetical protein
MVLIDKRDYVLSPKSTIVLDALSQCIVLGTKNHIFLLPISTMEGAGNTITTTKTSIGGLPALAGLEAKLTSIDSIQELEAWMTKLITEDLNLSKASYVLKIAELEEFNIKFGLLSKGLYYKAPHQKRRNGIGGISKKTLQDFQEFYGK